MKLLKTSLLSACLVSLAFLVGCSEEKVADETTTKTDATQTADTAVDSAKANVAAESVKPTETSNSIGMKEQFEKTFFLQCKQGANGLSEDVSTKLCECTFNKLVDEYTVETLIDMDIKKIDIPQNFQAFTTESAQACLKSITE